MFKFCFALFLILLTNFDATALKCWFVGGPGGNYNLEHRRNNPEITFALSGHQQNEDDEVLLDRRISCMHRSIGLISVSELHFFQKPVLIIEIFGTFINKTSTYNRNF